MANERHKTSYGATEGVRSGSMHDVLYTHAQERLHYYFWYVFALRALVDRLNAEHGQAFTYMDIVDLNATDQYGTGDRSDNDEVYKYFKHEKKNADILEHNSTAWSRVDAAHFNNLGISPKIRDAIAELASPAKDATAHSLFEQLKASCKGTRVLPASVNTGADKIVDNVHKRCVQKMMGDKAPITRANVDVYVTDAKASLTQSLAAKKAKGYEGVVAVRGRYIDFYNNTGDIEKAFRKAQDTVHQECHAMGLNPAAYTSAWVI